MIARAKEPDARAFKQLNQSSAVERDRVVMIPISYSINVRMWWKRGQVVVGGVERELEERDFLVNEVMEVTPEDWER